MHEYKACMVGTLLARHPKIYHRACGVARRQETATIKPKPRGVPALKRLEVAAERRPVHVLTVPARVVLVVRRRLHYDLIKNGSHRRREILAVLRA